MPVDSPSQPTYLPRPFPGPLPGPLQQSSVQFTSPTACPTPGPVNKQPVNPVIAAVSTLPAAATCSQPVSDEAGPADLDVEASRKLLNGRPPLDWVNDIRPGFHRNWS